MTDYFKGKLWAITGGLRKYTRKEAQAELTKRGASFSTSVSSKTHYVVSVGYDPSNSRYLSNKEQKARQHGIPIFNEPQFLAILEGRFEEVEALAPTIEEVEVDTREVLENLRGMLYEARNEDNWRQITELVDQTADAALPIVLDYIHQNHPEPPVFVETGSDLYRIYNQATVHDNRLMPEAWQHEALRGENHPKFKIVRDGNFRRRKLTGQLGEHLLQCSHLCELRSLDLSGNKLPMKFWEQLGNTPHMNHLLHLNMSNTRINAAGAAALRGSAFKDTLTHLEMREVEFTGGLGGFFEPGAWGALVSLDVSESGSKKEDLCAALARATHLKGLHTLRLRNNVTRNKLMDTDVGFAALMDSPLMEGVQRLELAENCVTPQRLEAMRDNDRLRNLTQLHIDHYHQTQYNAQLIDAIASQQLEGLERLNLPVDYNTLGRFWECRHLTKLKGLNLHFRWEHPTDASLPRDAFEGFFNASHLDSLEAFWCDAYTPPGFLARLLTSGRLPRVQRFGLSRAAISEEDLQAYMDSDQVFEDFYCNLDHRTLSASFVTKALKHPRIKGSRMDHTLQWIQRQHQQGNP